MKKIIPVIFLCALIIFSAFSIDVLIVKNETLQNEILTKNVCLKIPESFEYNPVSDNDEFFSYYLNDEMALYVYCQDYENVPEVSDNISQKDAEEIFNKIYLQNEKNVHLELKLNEKTKLNGITAYILNGKCCWADCEPDECYHSFVAYIMATKENVYLFVFLELSESFTEYDIVGKTMNSVVLNGTYFSGDEPAQTADFTGYSAKKSFSDVAGSWAWSYSFVEKISNVVPFTMGNSYRAIIIYSGVIIVSMVSIVCIIKNGKAKKQSG